MKWLLALGAFIGTVVAQQCLNVALTEIPSCAQNCFLTGAPQIGCGGTDFACQCEKEAALYAAIEGCVASGCPSASVQKVIDGASSVCNCATAGSSATTQGSSFTVGGSYVAYTSASTAAATASATASSAASSTAGSSIASYTYKTPTALTPTATAGAAPTMRAAMGMVGGVVAAVALL